MIVLAGDVGGTNTRLALYEAHASSLEWIADCSLPSDGERGLAALVRHFLGNHPASPGAACFGVAGPVKNGRVRTTNLPWELDESELERELGIARVTLINDLEATAWSIDALPAAAVLTVHAGEGDGRGHRAVVAAGTGLGVALLVETSAGHAICASEGGHAGFSPVTELDHALCEHLTRRFGRVSNERLVSGPGLFNIFEFLLSYRRLTPSPEVTAALQRGDPAAVIARAALAGTCAVSAEALDLFARYFGAAAGDIALVGLARGGVYLAGGIPPKILPKLQEPVFLEGFLSKGRMRPLVTSMPVHVILDDNAALLGAARRAVAASVQS